MIKFNYFLLLFFTNCISVIYTQETVEYKDQLITITNADVRKNEIRAGVQGVQLSCYAIFKYGENNIIGAEESDYLKQYYFFLEIKRVKIPTGFFTLFIIQIRKIKKPLLMNILKLG